MYTMIAPLLWQLKKRRLALGLKQNDMMLRAGISRQQYQRLESRGNPRLDTLDLIAKGLDSELMLIPKGKLRAVQAVLEEDVESQQKSSEQAKANEEKSLIDDPWQGLLGDDE